MKKIVLRMTDYGVASNYLVRDECPYCGSTFTNIRTKSCCCDGEWTYVHLFDCSNADCRQKHKYIQYIDVLEYNDRKDREEMRSKELRDTLLDIAECEKRRAKV